MPSCCCLHCINQSEVGIIESFGKFSNVIPPGLTCLNCISESVSGTVSLRIQKMCVITECPTKDQTYVRVETCIMHRVIPSHVHTAFYSLAAAHSQIESYVTSIIRSLIPTQYTLEQLFLEKHELAARVQEDLAPTLSRFGREIIDLLILDVEPRRDVKQMINNQLTQRYQRTCAQYRGDIEKIQVVKSAEAQAEVTRLNGVGLAEQQKVVTGGFRMQLEAWEQVEKENGTKNHMPESEIMATMLMLQYFDMMNDMTRLGRVKPLTYFMPPGGMGRKM